MIKMECSICEQIKEKKARIVYEDEKTVVVMSPKPLAKGHLIVYSKEHYNSMDEVPIDLISHFFYIASFASTVLFESGGNPSAGTNIIVNDGLTEHFAIHVIPRSENDGINFRWELKQANPRDLEDAMNKLKEETFFIGKDLSPEETPVLSKEHSPEKKQESGDDNYLIKQLDRIP